MAGADRRTPLGLKDRLTVQGHRFELFEALALLEHLARRGHGGHAGAPGIGDAVSPRREPVRFRSPPSLRFPSADIVRIDPAPEGGAPVVSTGAFALAGHHGPLPDWLTEELSQRVRRGDRAAMDFLDLFNERLLQLMYRARRENRVGFGYQSPDRTPAAGYLMSLLGLGTPGLQGRLGTPDRGLLQVAGLMAGTARSAAALERLLGHQLDLEMRVEPLTGRWLVLDDADRTRLSARRDRGNALGVSATVGGRVWDVASAFTLVAPRLGLAAFESMLPDGARHRIAAATTRFFVGPTLEFRFELRLAADEVPPSLVSARPGGARLGWTSFLRAGPARRTGVVRLRPRMPEASASGRRP
jgi:type VI secretion system protein ImpH